MLQGWIIGLSFVIGAIVLGYVPAQLLRKRFGPKQPGDTRALSSEVIGPKGPRLARHRACMRRAAKGWGRGPCGRRKQAMVQVVASEVICAVSVCQRPSRPIQTSV